MLRVGLTGGIGCGKTKVAGLFAAHGVPVLDADLIARDLVEPGRPALSAICTHFGPEILADGRLDRARLRQRIFANPADRQWLECLLHPLVYEEMAARTEGLDGAYCVLVIPLLIETGRRDFVDRLLVVDCAPALQRERVRQRDGLEAAEIDRILLTQMTRDQRLAAADDVIENSAGLAELVAAVNRLHSRYLAMAAR